MRPTANAGLLPSVDRGEGGVAADACVRIPVRLVGMTTLLLFSAVASAAAVPRLSTVTTHMPRGVRPEFLAVAPDGTAYVQGDNPRKRSCQSTNPPTPGNTSR